MGAAPAEGPAVAPWGRAPRCVAGTSGTACRRRHARRTPAAWHRGPSGTSQLCEPATDKGARGWQTRGQRTRSGRSVSLLRFTSRAAFPAVPGRRAEKGKGRGPRPTAGGPSRAPAPGLAAGLAAHCAPPAAGRYGPVPAHAVLPGDGDSGTFRTQPPPRPPPSGSTCEDNDSWQRPRKGPGAARFLPSPPRQQGASPPPPPTPPWLGRAGRRGGARARRAGLAPAPGAPGSAGESRLRLRDARGGRGDRRQDRRVSTGPGIGDEWGAAGEEGAARGPRE